MNNQESRKKAIDQKTYDCVKILLRSGTPRQEIAEMLKISVSTVHKIAGSQSYEEYKADRSAWYYAKKKAAEEAAAKQAQAQATQAPAEPPKQVVEYRQSVTIQATHYMETELKKQTELLTMISNKLAFIVEELAGPAKEAK